MPRVARRGLQLYGRGNSGDRCLDGSRLRSINLLWQNSDAHKTSGGWRGR